MTIKSFINENRAELVSLITRHLGHVPKTASCSCPKSGTDHYHTEPRKLDDKDLRQWILNNDALYNWARRDGCNI